MYLKIKIFLEFLKIGVFSFGGGYAMIPFIKQVVIESNHWIRLDTFLKIISISQVTPGPIAINSSTFIGFHLARFAGAVLGTLGVICIPFCFVLLFARYYESFKNNPYIRLFFSFLKPVVLGLIIHAVISIFPKSDIDWKGMILSVLLFVLLIRYRINPILLITISGFVGALVF